MLNNFKKIVGNYALILHRLLTFNLTIRARPIDIASSLTNGPPTMHRE